MKRDWDLIRGLLIDIADDKDTFDRARGVPAWTEEAVTYHLGLLRSGEYISFTGVPKKPSDVFLTWAGQDLLAQILDDGLWNQTWARAKEEGWTTLSTHQLLNRIYAEAAEDF